MTKSLYSLILNDEIIRRIDEAALIRNTNRSNLINQILADYVSYTTPEKRINTIFSHINKLITGSVFEESPEINGRNMFLKTSLQYKYRPTIKYCVELCRTNEQSPGKLKVLYRIHSEELLYKLNNFFSDFIEIEKKFLVNRGAEYELSDGKFVRTFILSSNAHFSSEEIAKAINDYVIMFDSMLKTYLDNGFKSLNQMEHVYSLYASKSILI